MTSPKNNDIDADGGETSRFSSVWIGGGIWCSHAIALTILVATIVGVVPQFELWFSDMDAELSSMTIFAFDMSQFVVRFWYLLAMGLVLIDGPLTIGISLLPRRLRWIRTTWLIFPLFVAIILLLAVATAVLIPAENLIESLK